VPDVLPFVTELGDEDARWLHRASERRRVRAGEEIVPEGVPPRHLFVVIEGEFEASAEGPVRAATDGVLLCICSEAVKAKLAGDPTFERRLNKVISKFAPQRRKSDPPASKVVDDARPAASAEFHVPDVIQRMLRGDI
jgi:CRP-like cAMP-binding protein